MYLLIHMTSIAFFDYVWLVSVLLGTFVVAKSKFDLGPSHTWAGYRQEKPALVTHGIYAFMRHPIYVGISLFVVGAFLTTVRYAPLPLMFLYTAAVLYILIFLPVMARRETKILEQEFGDSFVKYKQQVRAFLPLKYF